MPLISFRSIILFHFNPYFNSWFTFGTTVHFGYCIQKAVSTYGKKVVLIGSGDLSHKLTREGPYGFATEGPVFDNYLVETIKSADFKN